jgi:hypothetical protein
MAKNATCLVKTIILINLILLTASNTSRSAGTPEQRRACEEDAFKFCRKVIPDVPRITECMHKNRKSLSPPCRALFEK